MWNQTSDLWILSSDTLPLSHRYSMVNKAHRSTQSKGVRFISKITVLSTEK